MCTPEQLKSIATIIFDTASEQFGRHLEGVFLYGSYARGDNDSESDVDIMILVDMDESALKQHRKAFVSVASELGLKYDVLVSPLLQNKKIFERWQNTIPFYSNVSSEGVRIGG